MVEKLSSANTISDASLDTSVPVPMATPIAACWSAGASLTPSPVIAGISLRLCSIWTNRCLSAGSALQKTILSFFKISNCSSSDFKKNSRPSNALSESLDASPSKMLTSLAIAIAVSRASPVIIMTRIPALVHRVMLSATSGRAGSLIPTMPTSVSPLSISLYLEGSFSNGCFEASCPSNRPSDLPKSLPSLTASARHRNGRCASSAIFS
mmetsp:Transcript_34918/g.84503  ORF Transcript_34918/g.84503 Transcript_34918/m.84503 type:complete len:210 (-) Transcript_34918:2077-2706(-)